MTQKRSEVVRLGKELVQERWVMDKTIEGSGERVQHRLKSVESNVEAEWTRKRSEVFRDWAGS